MKVNSNKIGDVYEFYWQRLAKAKNPEEAKFLVRWLIEEYCSINSAELFLNPFKLITESNLLKIHFGIENLEKNKPIQYILNKTEFAGLNFYVNEDVLIPRPETEEMIFKIAEENRNKKNLKILDICTGSACIAVSLSYLLKSIVSAIELSESALKIAKINAEKNSQIINFFHFDVLEASQWPLFTSRFDVVVSNPPYVCESEKAFMEENVLNYEPSLALFVSNEDPLQFYKAILNKLDSILEPNGVFYAEINENYGNDLVQLSNSLGFNAVIYLDFKSKPRILKAWKA